MLRNKMLLLIFIGLGFFGFSQSEIDSMISKKVDSIPESAVENTDEVLFKVVEQMPRFPGCEEMEGEKEEIKRCADRKMLEYIYSRIKYPKESRENLQQGMFVGQFIIEKDGSVKGVKMTRSTGWDALDLVALEVLQTMADEITWIPGVQRGNPVRVIYTIPIRFRLEGDTKKKSKKRRKNKK